MRLCNSDSALELEKARQKKWVYSQPKWTMTKDQKFMWSGESEQDLLYIWVVGVRSRAAILGEWTWELQ